MKLHQSAGRDRARPRLIDEWQRVPRVWDHVRRAVDDAGQPGQFILTGSANPTEAITRHSGAGRFALIRMRPMTLFESGHSNGQVSLGALLNGEPLPPATNQLDVAEVADLVCGGGWPEFQTRKLRQRMVAMRHYVDHLARADVQELDGVRRDPVRVAMFVRSLARHVATPVSISTLATDVGDAEAPLDRDTAREYLTALERLMVVENLPAWSTHLRSKKRIRVEPKRYFVDPALAVAALHATPEQLLRDISYLGLLFETLVLRDLRVFADVLDSHLLYYGEHQGLEADVIIETFDGRWAAIEIKLGDGQVDVAAANLMNLVAHIDDKSVGPPAFLAVLVPGGYAYARPDGVFVLPLSVLRP